MTSRFCFVLLVMGLMGAAVHAQPADRAAVPQPGQTPTVFEDVELVQRYQATITASDLAAHLFTFASDYFEGRETTTRGQKLAAYYLAGQYRKMGLAPKGTAQATHEYAPEAYLQPFTVYGKRIQSAALTAGKITHTFSAAEQSPHAYHLWGDNAQVEGGVVFAGYGIASEDLGYDDYAAIKANDLYINGKWLVILRDEPLQDAETSLLTGREPSPYSETFFNKVRALFTARAGIPAGVLIVNDIGPRAGEDAMREGATTRAGQLNTVGDLNLQAQGGGRGYPPFYAISSELANQLLKPSGKTVAELQAQINETLEPVVFEVEDVSVSSAITFETYEAQTENVLAFIEGSDPILKDEVVVVSSHYDHIGINPALAGDQINNGADDDGSGTVAILEMAEAFMQAKADGYGPRRSILFLNVSGEEKGLLGSEYYAAIEPVLPIEKTVTNLNIDMIGRLDPTHPGERDDYVYIIGSNLISQELHDLNVKANAVTGTDLELHERFNSKDDPNRFYQRSDHWNFGKQGIPFIFFFTGTHEDYHGVDDEPEKIEYDRMARIARLIFATAWQVANQDDPPAVSGTGFN
ncbi:MAG: M28 family peptidase [Bacteroidota bacterium]